jgi:hypothetical protein
LSKYGLEYFVFFKETPNAEITGFKPDESVLLLLEKNNQSQDLKNVNLFRKAVWTEEPELKFYTDNGLGGRVGKKYSSNTPKIINSVL